MELSPEPGNVSSSSRHIHTYKWQGLLGHDQLHIPLGQVSLPQEQASGARDQTPMCV